MVHLTGRVLNYRGRPPNWIELALRLKQFQRREGGDSKRVRSTCECQSPAKKHQEAKLPLRGRAFFGVLANVQHLVNVVVVYTIRDISEAIRHEFQFRTLPNGMSIPANNHLLTQPFDGLDHWDEVQVAAE